MKTNETGKKIIKILYAIATVYCCFVTLYPIAQDMGASVVMLLCVLSFIAAKDFPVSRKKLTGLVKTKLQKFVALLLFFYTVFSFTGMFFLESSYVERFHRPFILYFIFLLVWTVPFFYMLLEKAFWLFGRAAEDREKTLVQKEKAAMSITEQIIAIVILAGYYMIWLYAFNPAITSNDSDFAFFHAHEGFYGIPDWQPPFYIMLLSVLLKICDSVSFLIFVQCVCFAVVFVRCLQFLLQIGVKRKAVLGLYIIVGFGISQSIQMITLWKDIPYMIGLLWLTLLTAKIVQNEEYAKSLTWKLSFVAASVFAIMIRHNGMIAVAVVCLLLAVVIKYHRQICITGVITFAIVFLIKGPVYDHFEIQPFSQMKYFALANDIVGTYYAGEAVSDEAMAMINEIEAGLSEEYVYSPYTTQYNKDALTEYTVGQFIGIYLENFFHHPKAALKVFLKRSSVIWSICRPAGEVPGCVNYLGEIHREVDPEWGYPYRNYHDITEILTGLSDETTNAPIIYIFCWRTAIYLLMIFYAMFVMWVSGVRKLRLYFPFLPILCNVFVLAAASGWSDYRYFWPTFVIGCFLYPYAGAMLQKRQPDKAEIQNF